jgi:hypothetical protein
MPELRLPFDPKLTPKQRAQLAYDNLLEACDGDQKAAFRSLCAFAQRQKEARRSMTYDERWGSSKGGRILAAAHRRMARDQGEGGGEFNIADLTEEQLRGIVEELAGEQGGTDRIRVAHDRRMKRVAQDDPNWFEGRPNPGGTIEPMTGTLTHDPAGSRSANAGAADNLPPSLRKAAEDMAILRDGRAQKSYAERFPDAARLGRIG